MEMQSTAVHPRLLEGIGIIVQRWAYVEALEGDFLEFMAGAGPGAFHVMLPTLSGKTITSWLRSYVEIKIDHPKSRERLLLLLTQINDLRPERNTIVHGLWHPGEGDGTGMIQTVNLARNTVVIETLITRADLDDLAHRIGEIVAELIHVGRNMGWHPPGRDIRV